MVSLAFVILFAFFDYIGFNTIGKWNKVFYRALQYIFQGVIVWFLWSFDSFGTALWFLFLWWVWIADLIYYLFFDILRWFGDRSGTAFRNEVLGNLVTWAWWTPAGLIQWAITKQRNLPIKAWILCSQALAGLILWGWLA